MNTCIGGALLLYVLPPDDVESPPPLDVDKPPPDEVLRLRGHVFRVISSSVQFMR